MFIIIGMNRPQGFDTTPRTHQPLGYFLYKNIECQTKTFYVLEYLAGSA